MLLLLSVALAAPVSTGPLLRDDAESAPGPVDPAWRARYLQVQADPPGVRQSSVEAAAAAESAPVDTHGGEYPDADYRMAADNLHAVVDIVGTLANRICGPNDPHR